MKSLTHNAIIIILLGLSIQLSSNWDEDNNSIDPDTDPDLIMLKADPININNASEVELQLLPWLSSEQIQTIIESRRVEPFKNKAQLIKLGINEIILEEMEDYYCLQLQT